MRLLNLLEGLKKLMVEIAGTEGDLSGEITGIANDSRKVNPGDLFVCIAGFQTDGHQYIQTALARGAAALLVQEDRDREAWAAQIGPEGRTPVIIAKNTRPAMAAAAHLFYGEPSKRFTLVGVTGTKGKTTTTYMLNAIATAAGRKTGLIGTVENRIGGVSFHASETTPESLDLQGIFARMAALPADFVVMEVSSQGLALDRVAFCDFDIGVFTNLYPDHISPAEHRDMEDYLAAKLKLFADCKTAVVNADSPAFDRVCAAAAQNPDCRIVTYAVERDADVRARDIRPIRDKAGVSVSFRVETPWFSDTVQMPLPGAYNVSNALAAIAVSGVCGVAPEQIMAGLAQVSVRGRTELVDAGQNFTVMVDYAHNAASLETLLHMLREYQFGNIVTVFGCGGNRARDRRFDMGEVSGRLSNLTVITSDNPRSEMPSAIMDDIETGIQKTAGRYVKIEDRKEAIAYALRGAQAGDLVLIAGKGHETTQTFRDRTIEFDDVQIASEILSGGQMG